MKWIRADLVQGPDLKSLQPDGAAWVNKDTQAAIGSGANPWYLLSDHQGICPCYGRIADDYKIKHVQLLLGRGRKSSSTTEFITWHNSLSCVVFTSSEGGRSSHVNPPIATKPSVFEGACVGWKSESTTEGWAKIQVWLCYVQVSPRVSRHRFVNIGILTPRSGSATSNATRQGRHAGSVSRPVGSVMDIEPPREAATNRRILHSSISLLMLFHSWSPGVRKRGGYSTTSASRGRRSYLDTFHPSSGIQSCYAGAMINRPYGKQ